MTASDQREQSFAFIDQWTEAVPKIGRHFNQQIDCYRGRPRFRFGGSRPFVRPKGKDNPIGIHYWLTIMLYTCHTTLDITKRATPMKIAIVGCGVVGSSWALVFARAGHDLTIFDQNADAARAAVDFVASADPALAARCRVADSLADALSEANYVQESAPERLPIKIALYKDIDGLLGNNTVVGSSTSGLPASSFTEGLKIGPRCLVAHPINPPHLIPLVELVPAPWTASETLAFTHTLMVELGQSPITLTREINGFVVNRLQSALLGEAFRLVEDGICTPEEVDAAVADGLGLRWCFMGPFATIDLNAANGIAEYCANLGPMYHGLAKEQADPRVWGPELVAAIEGRMRGYVSAEALPQRRKWRYRFLAAIVAAKREITKDVGV